MLFYVKLASKCAALGSLTVTVPVLTILGRSTMQSAIKVIIVIIS